MTSQTIWSCVRVRRSEPHEGNSLDYPGSVRWQLYNLAPHTRLLDVCSAEVATRAALLQTRLETLIDCQVEFEITN